MDQRVQVHERPPIALFDPKEVGRASARRGEGSVETKAEQLAWPSFWAGWEHPVGDETEVLVEVPRALAGVTLSEGVHLDGAWVGGKTPERLSDEGGPESLASR